MNKYNISIPLDLDDLTDEDKELAVVEFAEGLPGLERCLRTMWKAGLKTSACCAGNHEPYESAYIMMDRKVDIFSYLSEESLNEEMLKLEVSGKYQVIRVAGDEDKKNEVLVRIASDVLSGKKDNKEQVKEKLKKSFPTWWLNEKFEYKRQKASKAWQEQKTLRLKPIDNYNESN